MLTTIIFFTTIILSVYHLQFLYLIIEVLQFYFQTILFCFPTTKLTYLFVRPLLHVFLHVIFQDLVNATLFYIHLYIIPSIHVIIVYPIEIIFVLPILLLQSNFYVNLIDFLTIVLFMLPLQLK